MGLSNDLISQFTKVVNDDKKTTTENTVYGTIVETNGVKYVQLDGSNLSTPVSTTSKAKHGDRVTVLIKNHTAIVTGNITSPSAGSDQVEELEDKVEETAQKISEFDIIIADTVTTEQLQAESARIEKIIVTENATIKGRLEVNEGKIGDLESDNVTINKTLEAHKAVIDNLDSTYATIGHLESTYATIKKLEATDAEIYNLKTTYFTGIEADIKKLEADNVAINNTLTAHKAVIDNLDSTYATIGNLNAESAKITDLQTDVGSINTLIFGSATGDTIQTSFANAVIAQLGNAQIKSAMIDSLSADKIAAGDIITNDIRVMSEDGKLLISDETIQISDATRVRVQIGKDASGDYSINVWDADGNLMFSEGGITDSAIKDAIIRNDMVASDANISASKIDISSLFTEINNSTQTINSNRVLIDTDSGTLDVAFTKMTTDVNDLSETVSSQGTQITAVEGQITSKVWQQDIDTAVSGVDGDVTELSTKYSELKQSLDGFKTTVSNTYATKEEIDNIIAGDIELSSYPTITEMNSAIEQSAAAITQSVSAIYSTKEDLSNVEDSVHDTQSTAADNESRITVAESLIQQLSDQISMLVTDGNGASLMTQTEDGWTFSIGDIQSTLNEAATNIGSLSNDVKSLDGTISVLENAIGNLGSYVKIITVGEQPCIELGAEKSDFKVLITNTDICFMEKTAIPAYISNQALNIEKAVIQNEMYVGGFVWKKRDNGNVGLIWKGDS